MLSGWLDFSMEKLLLKCSIGGLGKQVSSRSGQVRMCIYDI